MMKRFFILINILLFFPQLITYSQDKLSIAILNLQAGVSRNQSQVEGLADILTVELHNSGAFIIKERLQVDKILSEMQLLSTASLGEAQRRMLGDKLKVDAILIGTINILNCEYNVDIRLVDIATGKLLSAAGGYIPSSVSDRDVMCRIAQQLVENLSPDLRSTSVNTLYGYLSVFPSDLGRFSSPPMELITAVNNQKMYGYNNWRMPTKEELSIMLANKHEVGVLSTLKYATFDCFNGVDEYVVRLVRTNDVVKHDGYNEGQPYLSPSTCDFGEVSVLDGVVSKQILLYNPSLNSIRVSLVKSASTDVKAIVDGGNLIGPGGIGKIKVWVNINGRAGAMLNRTLVIYLEDGRTLSLPVKIKVD